MDSVHKYKRGNVSRGQCITIFPYFFHIILITFSSVCVLPLIFDIMIYSIILTIFLIATIACSAWFMRKSLTKIAALQAEVSQLTSEIPAEVNELFSMLGKIDQFLVSQFLMPMAANQLSDKEWPAEFVIEDCPYPVSDYLIGATLKFDDRSYEITEVSHKTVRLKKV